MRKVILVSALALALMVAACAKKQNVEAPVATTEEVTEDVVTYDAATGDVIETESVEVTETAPEAAPEALAE